MRVGIITIVKVNNYGAELQANALQRKLATLGIDSEIIDYLFYKSLGHKPTASSRPIIDIGIANRLKEAISQLRATDRRARLIHKRFQQFHEINTKFSRTTYKSIDELYEEKFDYDAYIVGSDQVWNPRTNTSLEPYFLTFAPKCSNTVSYASSFGVSCIPDRAKNTYKGWLDNIRHISVREKQGVEIVKELTGRTAEHVLDPTLLLSGEDWRVTATEEMVLEPYVLLYDLIRSPASVRLAKEIAKELNAQVVRIGKSLPGCIGVEDAGPGEFLELFLKATYVVTNSFHGTAFSVNFQKPFCTVIPSGKKNTSRLTSFLESVELSNRILEEGAAVTSNIIEMPDYYITTKKLEELKSKSMDFLIRSLRQ